MPDSFNNTAMNDAPRDWRGAFAALPMETPPDNGWTRVARALDASAAHGSLRRERRTNWLIGLASAAVLAVVAWSPLSRWAQGDPAAPQPTVAATQAPGVRGPAAPMRSEPGATPATMPGKTIETGIAPASVALRPATTKQRKPMRQARVVAQQADIRPTPEAASPPQQTQAQPVTADAMATASTRIATLPGLQAQSAQLEAIVALARDDRVGNASELLTSELDAGIAAIDATLSQAEVTDADRQDLWQQRVDLLQQLAGIEATSRWLAAQGASNDTLLVSVD